MWELVYIVCVLLKCEGYILPEQADKFEKGKIGINLKFSIWLIKR
jgi:hypothetical protein